MKVHMIICLPGQIPYVGKFWFWSYGPKWAQNGPKMVKFRVFFILFKISLHVFAGFDLEWNFVVIICLLSRIRYLVNFRLPSYGPNWAQDSPKGAKFRTFLIILQYFVPNFAGYGLEWNVIMVICVLNEIPYYR